MTESVPLVSLDLIVVRSSYLDALHSTFGPHNLLGGHGMLGLNDDRSRP